MSLLQKFTDGLKKTSDNFKGNINNIFNKSKAPEEILSDLEDFMISSDIGLISTEKILPQFSVISSRRPFTYVCAFFMYLC